MTTTHSLKHNGAAYNDAAALINPDTKVTSGEGRALCTCGILSEQLPSGSARRAWHKEHKLNALDAEVATEKAETEALFGQDVLAGTPEDEVAEALAELVEAPAKPAKKRTSKKAAPVADGPADEPNAATETLPFTTAITPGFWRSLGRDAATTLVNELFPTVTVTANNNAHSLTFQGPAGDVPDAVQAVRDLWSEAILAVRSWKQTNPGFLGRATDPLERRREGFHLTEEFYRGFGHWYAQSRSGR